jgi:hypothetical protein
VAELERASTTAHGDAVAAAALVQRVAELERAVTAQGDAVAAAAREAPRDELARAAKVPRGTFCAAGASVATSDSEDGSGDEETGHDALPDAPFEPAPVDEPLARRLRQRHAADSAGDKRCVRSPEGTVVCSPNSARPLFLTFVLLATAFRRLSFSLGGDRHTLRWLASWRCALACIFRSCGACSITTACHSQAAAAAGWDGVQSGQFTVDYALEHFPDDGGELCTSEKKKTKVWAVLRVLQQCRCSTHHLCASRIMSCCRLLFLCTAAANAG